MQLVALISGVSSSAVHRTWYSTVGGLARSVLYGNCTGYLTDVSQIFVLFALKFFLLCQACREDGMMKVRQVVFISLWRRTSLCDLHLARKSPSSRHLLSSIRNLRWCVYGRLERIVIDSFQFRGLQVSHFTYAYFRFSTRFENRRWAPTERGQWLSSWVVLDMLVIVSFGYLNASR